MKQEFIVKGCLVYILAAMAVFGDAPRKQGGLVLQFDDGWTLWRTLVAPEVARVGGTATVFVNNMYIHNDRITFDDLRALQNEYGWEIGTHTYNHFHAPRYVQQHGLDQWVQEELERPLAELRKEGLQVRSLVFPFNASSPEIVAAIQDKVDSFRRTDAIALADGRRADKSLPGTSIDLTRYIPNRLLFQWIDMAQRQNKLLFLYGHRVLPDEHFVTGRVVSVSAHAITTDIEVRLPEGEDLVLVPNINQRSMADSLRGFTAAGQTIQVQAPDDLTRLTAPGATFLIGPSYGTRLSDFRELLEYAAKRVAFYRISDVIAHGGNGASP